MLNKFSVVYIALACCAAVVSVIGIYAGYMAAQQRGLQNSPEERHRIEQRLYLAFSAFGLAVVLKLAMVPGWFFMLQSLVPSVPGAVCLVGVHQNVPFFSWLASGLKIVLPMLYLTWLIISLIDRQIVSQPYLPLRLRLLWPIGILALVEFGTDLVFLFSLKPVKVSCCATIIDSAGVAQDQGFGVPENLLIALVFIMGGLLLGLLVKTYKARIVYMAMLVVSIALPVAVLAYLHSRLTPVQLPSYFLKTIYHHCLFCNLQTSAVSLVSLSLVVLGSSVALAVGVSFLAGLTKLDFQGLGRFTAFYRKAAFLSVALGIFLLIYQQVSG